MSGEQTRTTLSRELSDFLIQLSIAIHRYAMYPDGHPSLGPTVENLVERLAGLLQERGQLSLGVARNQLVIEGVATDPGNPVLKDLAGRLHRHHLGAVTFTRGVYFDELQDALQLLSVEADRTGEPLGLNPTFRIGAWEHVRLYPLTYDRLELVGEAPPAAGEQGEESRSARTRAAQLWVGLARAAMAAERVHDAEAGGPAPTTEQSVPDPTAVARAIQTHQKDAAYDQVIVGYMLQIADELKRGETPESVALKKRVSRMVSTLDGGTLQRLLQMGGDRDQRRKFLLSASEGMAVDAVLDLVQAAAGEEQQTISTSMLRMLEKLAKHADHSRGQRRRVAERSMREQVMKLIRDWSLADPNPDGYRRALEQIAGTGPLFSVAPEARYLPEPRRIIEMALEVDTMGESVGRAIDQLIADGQLRWLTEILSGTRAQTVTAAIWKRIATPERLREILSGDPLDVKTLDLLLPQLGVEAAAPMLEALVEADAVQTRRLLLDRLVALGPELGPLAVARLDGAAPWYVTRNLLSILAELPAVPPDFDPLSYADHEDPRVRREAMRLLLRNETTRDRAICLGLADDDEQVVRMAVTAAADRVPRAAIPLLVSRVTQGGDSGQRVAAIRVLAGSSAPAALEALLTIAAPRRALLGTKLPPRSPEYLAALAGLHRFGADPRARAALAAAARSRDPAIARAALG